jgi:hypothetical protein
MGCNCTKTITGYKWIGPNGESVVKRTEVEARALVLRQGGTMEPVYR